MEITINGATRMGDFNTVQDILQADDIDPHVVVVELNGAILPAADYATAKLKQGDTVEIVQFVAGG